LVLLGVKVSDQGLAARVTLKQTSGFPLLDEAALQTVRDWEFEPARINSIAVESEIEVPVHFQLGN
jgi:periplasmic protein TonB